MGGFWYPYADFEDARRRLTAFADASVGLACGISFSDGRSIGVVRKPATGSEWLWLNVLAQHVAAPLPPPARPSGMAASARTLSRSHHEMERVLESRQFGPILLTKSANLAPARVATCC